MDRIRRWSGVIAHVDTPTVDGRTIGAGNAADPIARPDCPLIVSAEDGRGTLAPDHEIGTVDRVWIDGTDLRAEGTVDVLTPYRWRHALLDGERCPTGLRADVDHYEPDGSRTDGWQVQYVMLTTAPAWSDVGITLDA